MNCWCKCRKKIVKCEQVVLGQGKQGIQTLSTMINSCLYIYLVIFSSMDDNDYNLGVTEDSSSRISSSAGHWSEEAGQMGQGDGEGDSSPMAEGAEAASGKCWQLIHLTWCIFAYLFLASLTLTLNQVGNCPYTTHDKWQIGGCRRRKCADRKVRKAFVI